MTEAIILAGGLGTRLREKVPDLPKPMAPINGRPFLEHQMDYWIGQGVTRFILSVGYKHDAISGHFGKHYRNCEIEYAVEHTPLGTGGGMLLAIPLLKSDKPFLVLNGDTFFKVSLQEFLAFHKKQNSDWTLALFKADTPDRYGRIGLGKEGKVEGFSSSKAQVGDSASGGIYLISPDSLKNLPWKAGDNISIESKLLPEFLGCGGRCYGVHFAQEFIDIGLPDDYLRASSIL